MANGHFSSCTSASFEKCSCEIRRYTYALGVSTLVFIGQALGGWYFNSLALWADSGHVATDMFAYGVAIYVAYHVQRSGSESLRRRGIIISTLLLALVLGIMLKEAYARLWSPPVVEGWGMLGIAIAGGIGNLLQHRIVVGGENHATTHGLALHTLTDLLSSVGVVIAGALILLTGWTWVDPLATFLIVGWIFWNMYQLLAHGDHAH